MAAWFAIVVNVWTELSPNPSKPDPEEHESEGYLDLFRYLIEAETEDIAYFVCHVLRSHGLFYPWHVRDDPCLPRTIRISVTTDDCDVTGRQHSSAKKHVAETIVTTDPSVLRRLGLQSDESWTNKDRQWGYVINSGTSDPLPPLALPFPTWFLRPLLIPSDSSWKDDWFILGSADGLSSISATRIKDECRQTVLSIDFVGFLDYVMLGPSETPGSKGTSFQDWADAYGRVSSQSQALLCCVDRVLRLVRDEVVRAAWEALPASIDYYPPGTTAPLIITGDSDDATPEQLKDYLEVLQQRGIGGSILLRTLDGFDGEWLRSARMEGHCFGIHPYSSDATALGYSGDYAALLSRFQDTFHALPVAVRNHRFQYVGRSQTLNIERDTGVQFDLNCVAASGDAWVGSGSGIGFPIAFPPQNGRFHRLPMHLPTVIEDDVFLFRYDYCYRAFKSGDYLAVETATRFLEDWVLTDRMPACINLHPEHIVPSMRMFFDAILEWSVGRGIWTPTLNGFAAWLDSREDCAIQVVAKSPIGPVVEVSSSTAVTMNINNISGEPRLGAHEVIHGTRQVTCATQQL